MTGDARKAVRTTLGAIPLLFLVIFVLNPQITPAPKAAALLCMLVGVVHPASGLLLLAVGAPLALRIAELMQAPPIRLLDACALGFIGGWLLRDPSPRRAAARTALAVSALGATVIASVASQVLQFVRSLPGQLDDMLRVQRELFWFIPDPIGVATSVHLLIGVALMAAVIERAGDDPPFTRRLAAALVLSASVSGLLAVLITQGIGTPGQIAWQTKFAIDRFSGHIGDVNAAGSFFVLLIALAAGAIAGAQAWGARAAWILALLPAAAGLALSGSRSAYAAAVIVAAGAAWVALAGRLMPARRALVMAGAIVLVAAGGALLLVGLPVAGADLRQQFNETSARMIAAHPMFGIGIGQYYRLSLLALPPELAWLYATENAHDYFLQVTAELGVTGIAAFVFVLAAALATGVRRLRAGDPLAAGAVAGAVGYLLTSLTGHPFLVQEAAVSFWLVLGLAAVPGAAQAADRRAWTPRERGVVLAIIALLALSVPFRGELAEVTLPPSRDGLGPWTVDREGRRFRQASEYFAIYADPMAAKIAIPLRRAPSRQGRPITVGDQIPGWAQHSTRVTGEWTVLELDLPGALPLVARQRINLRVYEDGGPPADARDAGVWVGEIEVLARHR